MKTSNLVNKIINFGSGLLIAGNLLYSSATAQNSTPKYTGLGKNGGMEVVGKDTNYYVLTSKDVSPQMQKYAQETSNGKTTYVVSSKDLNEKGLKEEFYKLAEFNLPIKRQANIEKGDKNTKIKTNFPLNKIASKYEVKDFGLDYIENPEKRYTYEIPNDSIKGELGDYISKVKECPTCEEKKENNLEKLSKKQKDLLVQRGIILTNNFTESPDSITIEYDLNKHIKDAIDNSKSPSFLLNGTDGRITVNEDTTKLYVTAPKADMGKKISIGVIDKQGKIPGLGDKNKPLAYFYGYLNYLGKGEQVKDSTQTNGPSVPGGNIPNEKSGDVIFIDKSRNTIINNYNQQQDSAKIDTTEKSSKLRTLLEIGKYVPGKEGYVGGAIQVPLSEKFYLGLEGRAQFGKNTSEEIEKVNFSQQVTQNIILNSEGLNNTTTTTSHPFQAGVLATYLVDKFAFNASAGINGKKTKVHTLNKGTDYTTDKAGNILEEKPFCVENFDNSNSTEGYGNASIDFFPTKSKNISVGLEGEVNDLFSKPTVFGGVNFKFLLSGGKK